MHLSIPEDRSMVIPPGSKVIAFLYGAAEHSHIKGILPLQPAPQPYPCLECELARKADLHSHTGGMDRW